MNTKPTTRLGHGLWLLFPLLIACCLSIQQASAKRGMTIDDLAAITDIKIMTLSPDGKYVAFQTIQGHKDTNSFTVGWHIAATKAGARAQKVAKGTEVVIGSAGGIYSSDIIWSPDSEWIYFTKKHDGAVQIWRGSRKQPVPQQVTHNAGDVRSLQMSPDGSKVFFTIGRTRAESKNLKRKIAEQGILQQEPAIYTIKHGIRIPFCTDGRKRWRVGEVQKHSCRLTDWVYTIKSGVERKATKAEVATISDQEDSSIRRLREGPRLDEVRQMERLSPNGTLAWFENENPEVYKGFFPPAILKVSKNGKNITCPVRACISQEKRDFKGLWWHPNGKKIIFLVKDGPHNSLSSIYSWTPGEDTVRTTLRTDDYIQLCNLTGNRLICTQSTWTSPREIVSVNLDSGKITTLVNVNPEFKTFKFTTVEKILGEDDYGHKVYAHFVYPKGYKKGQKYPLVITSYTSRGFLRGATGDEQPIHAYAQKGIAVLSFHHSSTKYEFLKKLKYPESHGLTLRNIYIKQGPATAIENMVERLVKRGIIDPERIGISGFSWGSQVMGAALLRRNYAAASSSALTSIATYNKFTLSNSWGKMIDVAFGKTSSAKGQKIRSKISLEVNAQKINTPWLIQVAGSELKWVEVGYNALKNADKPIEMIIYPDERHSKWQPIHKYITYSRNLDWFNFWLRGVEDTDSRKAEQYQRWHKLQDMHIANLRKLKKE